MTVKLFISDTIKTTLIGSIIYIILMIVVESIVKLLGNNFFIFLWIAFIIIMFVFLAIYPLYIAPLFNKFEALDINDPKEKEL